MSSEGLIPASERALDGFTVVDLSGTIATATCGKLFADFGARVVNIEPPGGHPTRHLPPFKEGAPAGEASGIHALVSPNKESVVLDIRDPRQRDDLFERVASADVVLEGETPGTLAALGLDYESLKARWPQLILCSISWWGQTGPFAQVPASDQAILCNTGNVRSIGPVEGPPILPSGYPVQVIGGVTAFDATLVHLIGGVLGTSRPAHVDVSMFEAAMALTETAPPAVAVSQARAHRFGVNRLAPTYPMGIFETADGWLGVTALTPKQWHDLCDLVGIAELKGRRDLDLTINRLMAADLVDSYLAPALKKRTAHEWFVEGQARRIPLALVPTMADLFKSEQLRALGSFRTVSSEALGTLEVPSVPLRLHGTPARKDGPVARLGEHRPLSPAAATSERPPSPARPPAVRPHCERPKILAGLRVIDLTMGWAGPLAARHLADMGAEVIKVESRTRFDWWRGWDLTPERIAAHAYELAPNFNVMNRNKLGITLDLGQRRGVELLLQLVAISDVVIENFSAEVMPKLGIQEPVLRAVNPRLVMLSMPPFGAGGPWHAYRAYGSTVEQASGLPHLQGSPGQPPVMTHVSLGDPVAGIYGAAGLLLAVLHQQRTGRGQHLDMSQVEATTSLGLHGIASQVVLGRTAPRTGNRHPLFAPQGVYRCAGDDEWLMLAVDGDGCWQKLVDVVGDAVLADPQFASAAGRHAAHDEIDARLAAWAGDRDRDEAVARLLEAGVPAAGVLGAADVLAHPQHADRGFWQWIDRAYAGMIPHPVAPHRAGEQPCTIDSPAPTLGEHSREVLGTLLHLGAAELDALEAASIIGQAPVG